MALNSSTTTISKTAYLQAGSHPVAMAETPNALSLYVANQGNGTSSTTVLNLSTTDLSTVATIPVPASP